MTSADGFVSSAAGLSSLAQQASNLRAAVDSGQFSMDPTSAQDAAKACQAYHDKLLDLAAQTQQLGIRNNFGDCDEGNALSTKFGQKAMGGPNSAYDVLTSAVQVLKNLAQTYQDAGRTYQQTEEANAQAFNRKA